MLKFMSYSDDGHGWLRVPRKIVEEILGLEKISNFSYQNKGWIYLEEDCDCSVFLNKLKELNLEYSIKHSRKNGSSHIRNYERFKNNNADKCIVR